MRRDRPHQGAQLRFEDIGDYRPTAFTTNTKVGQLADLKVRHRLRAHCQGTASTPQKTPGSTTSPLQGIAQNHIWSLNVTLTCNLPAFSQLLAPTSTPARAWKPRTIHLRLISIPATTAHHTRRTALHYKTDHPWTDLLLTELEHLQAPPTP